MRAQVAIEAQVRLYGWIDQQRLEPVLFGQVSGVIAAQGAAHQQRRAEFADQRLQLGDGLTRMMMQGRYAQLVFQTQVGHGAAQLAGLVRGRRTVEAVNIENGCSHGAGGYYKKQR